MEELSEKQLNDVAEEKLNETLERTNNIIQKKGLNLTSKYGYSIEQIVMDNIRLKIELDILKEAERALCKEIKNYGTLLCDLNRYRNVISCNEMNTVNELESRIKKIETEKNNEIKQLKEEINELGEENEELKNKIEEKRRIIRKYKK